MLKKSQPAIKISPKAFNPTPACWQHSSRASHGLQLLKDKDDAQMHPSMDGKEDDAGSIIALESALDGNTASVSKGIAPLFNEVWQNLRNAVAHNLTPQKALSTFVAIAFLASILLTPLKSALAAPTGGRMGGSFGSTSRQQSSTPSYSAPSYNRGFSRGYTTGYYSRPSVTISPWGWGGWGGGYYSPFYSSPGVIVSTGPSILPIIVFGAMFWFAATSVLKSTSNSASTFFDSSLSSALGPGITVAEISVAVNVPRRDDSGNILNFLQRLSRFAETDSRVGVSNLVSQVALELLRQRRSIVAASTSYNHYRDGDKAQREFSTIAVRERSKFERETLNRYGGVDYAIIPTEKGGGLVTGRSGSSRPTLAVISLIVAIDGDSTKLPKINSFSDVEKALTAIATDVKVSDCLRSAEILWTPEDSNDVLTERDVAADYPSLRNV